MTLPADIKTLLERPVAILGYGVSGRAVADLLRSKGIRFMVYDQRDAAAEFAQFGMDDALQHRLAVVSPGFSGQHPWLQAARGAGCTIMGEVDFAALFWPGSLIAVTGTNGKTTTVDFLTQALQAAGRSAVATGNIGHPVSRLYEIKEATQTTAVCEISSFQAETIEHLAPDALIWTNFAEDHLDRYASMKAYFRAKWQLVERLLKPPRLFVGRSVVKWAEQLGYKLPKTTQVIDVSTKSDLPPPHSCFQRQPQLENYLLVRRFWLDEGLSLDTLDAAARHYQPPRHRMELINLAGPVACWDDSKATNFASALAALRSFSRPVHWIAGGKLKGGDLEGFVREASPHVQEAYLIGEAAPQMATALEQQGIPQTIYPSLEAATKAALEAAEPGASILLSPGFSSLDQFAGFEERGNRFQKAVLGLLTANTDPIKAECAVITKSSS